MRTAMLITDGDGEAAEAVRRGGARNNMYEGKGGVKDAPTGEKLDGDGDVPSDPNRSCEVMDHKMPAGR